MPHFLPSFFSRKFPHTWALVLLALATIALYGQFLWNPIIFDDVPFFRVNPDGAQQVSSYHFSFFELRSLPYATLAWSKNWFGLEIFHFRVENLLLHLGVVLTLYFFLTSLFVAVETQSKNRFNSRHGAFLAALLFALHPVATYATGYLVQRTIIMASLFGLLAMLSWMRGSTRGKASWLWVSVVSYYLAVFSKEHVIMLPTVLLALTVLQHEDWRTKLRESWYIFAAMLCIAAFVVLQKERVLGSVYEESAAPMMIHIDGELAYPLSILTQSWLFFKYAALWILPNPAWMSIDIREPFAQSILSLYLLALAGYLTWGAAALWLLLKRGLPGIAGFGLLFPWLMFFTEFSAVRIQEEFVLYRSYLWAIGAFCLLPIIIAKCRRRVSFFGLIAIALAFFMISMERLTTFSHPILLWDDAEKLVRNHLDLPGVSRIYYNRGTELSKIGKYDVAIADFKQALAITPGYADVWGNLAGTYLNKGDLPNALAAFENAIGILKQIGFPPNAQFIYGHALTLERLGEIDKARADYRLTCQLANKGCERLENKTGSTADENKNQITP